MGFFKFKKNKKSNPIEERKYIINDDTPFAITEAYKGLRTNVTFSRTSEGCRVIGLTSSFSSEGKSINCLNLAITFAKADSKVLIIDCDLRRPNISRLLDIKSSPGLSNFLVNLNKLSEVVRKTEYEGLDVITSGDIPPNPSELLSSARMEDLIGEMSTRYDYIFIDTPPVNMVTDAAILSKLLEGMIFVVREKRVDKDEVINAISQLEFAGMKILGFVFNDVSVDEKKYYRRHHYGYSRRKWGELYW